MSSLTNGNTNDAPPLNAVLLMDRFVSASSAQDAVESLQGMVDGFKQKQASTEEEFPLKWQSSWIWQHEDLADHLLYLLQLGVLKTGPAVEEGPNLVCQLYLFLAKDIQCLKLPGEGRLLEALLDVMDNPKERPIYTRVLALQVLELLSKQHISTACHQWLAAPNGLHRLADLLNTTENPMDEPVRNQALVVAQLLATQAPIAKVFLFAEVESGLLNLCWQQGGLTKGNAIVLDALCLVQELLKHADPALQDLVWQRPNVAPRLAQLLDLRGGDEFLHPPDPSTSSQRNTKKNSAADNDGIDDLDSLLQSGETRKTTLTEEDESEPFVPHLLPSEELVIQSVLQILHILLESESVRSNVWKAHSGLCSLVWELALVATPSQPPAFAMPSAQLQQAALELVAEKIADSVTMDQHHGMDRLLFLVCTGAAASSIQEKMGISQAALAVLRQVLNTERIHELLLNTLAPSPVLEGEAPGPTVVQKLWNTVAENLVAENNEIQVDPDRRTLFLSGALGGLALLLKDEQSRMMLYKVTPPMASIEHMLEALTTTKTTTGEDPNAVLHHQVQWTLLRFLCEWVCDTPFMVQTLLSSTVSTNLASMAADTKSPYTPLVHLLLGLAMHSLEAEQDCGGWTRAGILQLIKKTVGISKYTSSLEKLKTRKDLLPWTICDLEYQHWSQWYQKAVWVVRKRVVEELAGASSGGGASSSDEEEDKETNRAELGDTTTAAPPSSLTGRGKSKKSLQKLIARQAKEMDVLRQELDRAQTRIASQESQLGTWKRRMESTPTELDNLLSEFTSKTADLEETVQQMQKEVKDTKIQYEAEIQDRDEKVQKSRQEADQLRTQEQEAREDRERMEQELAALSQAYASLEEDYRHRQTGTSTSEAGAPTGQESQQQAQHQQQGEASQQQASSAGSTEVATLRAENARLRNDARAADEWMSMAVQRMNEMGSHSGNLEQQAVSLQQQIQELQTQSQTSQQQQERELRQEIAVIESQLQQERTLREGEISNAGGECNVLLESERQMGAQLSRQLENVQDEMRKTILAQKSEKQELEQSLHDAVTQQHQSGKEAGTTTSFQQPAEDNDRRLQQLIAELEATIESKNVEILSLNASLEQARQGLSTQPAPADHPSSTSSTASNGLVNQQLEAGRKEVEEIRHRSQEDIYKRESTIRELENRLSSGLGGFKLEDIRVRDEEIKELRAANEAAQDWMAKAVEHHQMLSSQVATLREEKAALSAQLVENKGQFTPNNANMASTKLLESELSAKSVEIERLQAEMARLNQSFQGLREESNSSQDIQQELGITREDVSILKQELAKSQEKVKTLEGRLKENALSEENKKLRASKDGLQSQLAEFQAWADVAQKKIADIVAAKANVDKQLSEANAQVRAKNSELAEKAAAIEKECEARTALATERDGLFQKAADLQSKLLAPDSMTSVLLDPETESDRSVIEQLKAEMASLETENKTLADIREKHEKKIVEIQAHSQELQAWTEGAQQEIADILSAKEGLEKLLAAEKELTKLCQDEIEELKKTLEKAPQKPLEDMRVLDDTAQPGGSMGVSNDAEEFFSSGGENAPVAAEGSVPIVDHLQQLLRVKEEELKVVQAQHSADEDIVHQWEERVAELETEVESLQTQMQDQEAEANAVISQWQDSFNDSENRCSQLKEELENAKTEKESLETSLEIAKNDDKHFEEAKSSLDAQIATLEDAIEDELEDVLHVDNHEAIGRDTIEQLKEELKVAEDTLARDEDVVQQWEGRVAELETSIKSLETQLQEQEEEANNIITQWQDAYSASDERCSQLEEGLLKATEEKRTILRDLESSQKDKEQLEVEKMSLEARIVVLEDLQNEEQDQTVRRESSQNEIEELLTKLKAMEDELNEARKTLARDEDVVSQREDRVKDLDAEVMALQKQLQKQEEDATNAIQQWQEGSNIVDEKCIELERELEVTMKEKKSLEATIEKLKFEQEQYAGVKSSFEAKMSSLEEALKGGEATDKELTAQLRLKDEELRQARDHIARDEDILRQREERIAELAMSVQDAERQLREKEKGANNVISRWQGSCCQLEERCSSVEEELTRSAGKLADRDGTIEQLQSEVECYRSQVEELKPSSHGLRTSEAKLAGSKAELLKLKDELEQLRQKERTTRETLEAELAGERGRHTEARDEIEALTTEVNELRRESEDVLGQWSGRAQELEETILGLEEQLKQQEDDANGAISSWESKVEELEKELESTEKEHLELKAELRVDEDKTLVDAVEELRRQQIEAVDKSIKRKAECENLEATNLELEGSVERQRLKIESFEIERGEEGGKLSGLQKEFEVLKIRCEQLSVSEKEGKDQSESSEKELKKTQQERNRLKETLASKSREKLEDERDRLTIVIAQLEEELHAANAMVQAFVTDGSSEKATEMAAQALRDEMEELKFQIDDYRRVSEEEKVAREAAELEIERLKEDVAALVSLGDKENASNEIQLRTAKATERLKRKERAEIEQLHKSLFRAMDELEVARAAEKSANEKLSKVRLQTSICEQEIMAAKSEVYFLTQAMEEMRLAEESKAASLEYRISSLEDENDVLRKYHAGDLDNARNELAQVTMEKDRILHQLKESEKTNASLVFAASKGESNDSDDTESLEGEITRLRVENAHLITVASDDKVRHERRLREALAAHAATAEADTILEHELRIAAEATIQTLKVELEDLRNEEKREGSPPDMDDKNRSIEELTNEIESLKFDFQVIQKENSNLKSKMEKAASKAKTQIDFITDDCRKAQAKAHKLEREGRYEAAVKSEVAKLRMPQGLSTPEIRVTAHDDWMLVSNAPAATDRFGPSLTNAEAFDLIRKQKEDIQEERTMYLEFLAEHDDLLALLAQHDLERTCLKEAMFEAGLQAAVDEAVRKAEEKSAEQYGRIIRIS